MHNGNSFCSEARRLKNSNYIQKCLLENQMDQNIFAFEKGIKAMFTIILHSF